MFIGVNLTFFVDFFKFRPYMYLLFSRDGCFGNHHLVEVTGDLCRSYKKVTAINKAELTKPTLNILLKLILAPF